MAEVTGGNRIGPKLEAMARSLRARPSVKVGFLAGATYPDGTSVPLVAAVNEFGRPGIGQPPRPFFRNMVAAHKAEWPRAIADALKANNMDAVATLRQVGLAIRGQLQASIRDLVDPPIKESTARAKGFDKPLIDTAHMMNSADYEVEE